MKNRSLLFLLLAMIFLGSCHVVNFSDNSQHKHLRKVAVDSPDAITQKADNEKSDINNIAEAIDLSENTDGDIEHKTDFNLSEDAVSSKDKNTNEFRPTHIKNPVKMLNIFSAAPKMMAKVSPEKETYIDPVTILIWALIAVLILALLAILIPDILDLIIGLLVVVLIVVLILYVAGNI